MSSVPAPHRLTLIVRSRLSSPGLRGAALGVCAALIWGSYLALSKLGITAGLRASDIAVFRYGVVGILMLPWLMTHRPADLGGIGWRRAAALALLAGPLFVLIGISGYKFAPLAHGAVFQPAGLTLGGVALAALVFHERSPAQRLVGMVIMLLGLILVAGPGLLSGTILTPVGDAMFLSPGVMWAGFTILSKRWSISPLAATAAVSALSALIYVPVQFAVCGWQRLLSSTVAMIAVQVLVQGVLSGVVAVIAFAKAVELIGPTKAATFPAFVPAAALLIGIPITGDVPTLPQMGGLCLVTAGLLFAVASR